MANTKRFRTQGGTLVTWTEDHVQRNSGGGGYWVGPATCGGCGWSTGNTLSQAANDHSKNCRQVP